MNNPNIHNGRIDKRQSLETDKEIKSEFVNIEGVELFPIDEE
jgi:hypothetical protein